MKSLRSRVPKPPLPAPSRAPRVKRSESLAGRTLVSIARQRHGVDAPRCQLVFEHLDTALCVHAALLHTLAEFRLSELQFAMLVALFALDPEPVSPADLADYTAVSRAAITEAAIRLERLGFISRTRDAVDRRVFHLHLTTVGRSNFDAALERYLAAIGLIARHVPSTDQADLISAYRRLQRGAAEIVS